MILIAISENLNMSKITLPQEEKVYFLGSQEQNLPIAFVAELFQASRQNGTIEFTIVNKVDAVNMAFTIGSLIGGLAENEKLTVICDEELQKGLAGFKYNNLCFASGLKSKNTAEPKKGRLLKKITGNKEVTATEAKGSEPKSSEQKVDKKAEKARKAPQEGETKKEASKTEVTKAETTKTEAIKSNVSVDGKEKSTKSGRPTTLLKKAGIEKELYEVVLAAVEKSSDANIGLPICMSSELVAHDMDVTLSAGLVEKVKPIYDKLK